MKLSEQAVATTFTLAGLLASAVATVSAQVQPQTSQQPPDSVVAVVADAMSLPFVPPDQLPVFGTFWEVRSSLPCLTAPLPFPPLDTNTPVYAIGDPIVGGQFLVDETAGQVISPQAQSGRRAFRSMSTASILQAQVDELQAFVAGVQAAQTNAQLGGNGQMSRLTPEGGGIFGPTPNTPFTAEDLWLEIVTVTNATGIFVVHPPEAEATTGVYDLLMTTNLSPNVPGLNLTNWYWVLRTSPGETNLVVPELLADQAYFRLARTNDTDGDGLSDAIEMLVTHTDPNTPDPNPFPVIVSQPLSQTVFEGDSVTFTVQANGMLPLSYQWQFTASGLATTNLTGATDPSLTLNNISSTAAGTYSVLVFNLLGSAVSSNAVLTVTNSGEFATVLVGPRQDYRFKGDKTYYVDGTAGPVDLYGTTTIEGGAVVKYATNAGATLVIRGSLVCQTTPWRPAIFTAADDDMLGWPILSSSGTPTNFYALVALDINSPENVALKHVRIIYAQTAIHYSGDPSRDVLGTVRHAQILHCASGLVSDGSTNRPCQIDVANVLFSDVGQAITGTHFRGSANHLTVDRCSTFVSDTTSSALGFFVTNSVFGNTTSLGDGAGLDGSNNGFYTDHAPQFGTGGVTDDQSPFAPTGGVDGQGNPYIYIVNGQGAYYLRDDSPFAGTGATNMDSSLKSDFAQMTTAVPPDFFCDDINSSMTLSPAAIRDPEAADLGYHYPVVDYVLMLATVNNATLSIDPGTVLALVGYPYWWANWGIRLNPGGCLNVNGLPTNHVVFAHLEAVQESPVGELGPFGPMLNWRDLGFFSGLATPYPEVRVHYADFPTISAGYNAHLCSLDYDPELYSIVSHLELDGCLLQGGWFVYDDGGPAGRQFTLRNTVFDRCEVWMLDMGAYEYYFQATAYSAQVSAANNLFYQCFMALRPVEGSGSWSFTDNIFDNASFPTPDFYTTFLNGPITTNHHNAYVGMSGVPNGGGRLIPAAPTTTDPDLPSLNYETGPLGKFYLPATATNLLAKGSRLAGAAGEYHFTSRTNSLKEATSPVSIGPHYLALVSGAVPDSNTDGVPDFIADRNGDGVAEADEIPWQTPGTGDLRILLPADAATVAGTTPVHFDAGTNSADPAWVRVLVDGLPNPCSSRLERPAHSVAAIEADTAYLTNGPHTVSLEVHYSASLNGVTETPSYTLTSFPITVNVTNSVRYPAWQDQAESAVKVDAETDVPSAEYTIWFFNSQYPKAPDPFNPAIQTVNYQGVATNGVISYSEVPAFLGFGDGTSDPDIYSFTEFTGTGGGTPPARANPNTRQNFPFPPAGYWVVSYADSVGDYWFDKASKVYRPLLDDQDDFGEYYYHGVQMVSWLECAETSAGHIGPLLATPGGPSQTYPLRDTQGRRAQRRDAKLLLAFLSNTNVCNFFGNGHGLEAVTGVGGVTLPVDTLGFMDIKTSEFSRKLKGKRFRFAFLDGCETADDALLKAFGADKIELVRHFPGDPGDGTLPLSAYTDNLRPSAFLSWNTETPMDESLDEPRVDDLGRLCTKQTLQAFCFWHGQLAANWTYGVGYGPMKLQEAIQKANRETLDQFGGVPELDLSLLWHVGYRDLHCTEFNHAGDWPIPPGP